MRWPRVLRMLAVLIAVAGAIDPSIASSGYTRDPIAIISGTTPADEQLADRLTRELAPEFAVVRGPLAGAAAVVLAGDRLPPEIDAFPSSTPAFAVTNASDNPTVQITAVRAPSRATFQSRVPISTSVRVEHARGRTIDISLQHAGLTIDRVTQRLATDDERVNVNLTLVPTAEGSLPLTVSAGFEDRSVRERADILVNVSRRQWAVLALDKRPSWLSTFVRRALEGDPRFIVTSRVVTSRNVSTDTGQPAELDNFPSLALFDAVIVGAPEELTDREVAGLDNFLRRRGGAVCLLLDQQNPGAFERLWTPPDAATRWQTAGSGTPASIDVNGADPVRLLATELAWPDRLPAGGTAIATSVPASGDQNTLRPIIWSVPAGAGRVIVSGALDAWRYRDVAPSPFDRFWRTLVADAAEAPPPMVDVQVERALVAPAESTDVTIAMRDVTLADPAVSSTQKAAVTVLLETPAGPTPVRAWPDGSPGRFRATVKAPEAPGTYRLAVTANGTRVSAPLVVASDVSRPTQDDRNLIAAWASSHGGLAVPAAKSNDVRQALDRLLRSTPRQTPWHPMRSPWWILPFGLCLGLEWWQRRRRGLL